MRRIKEFLKTILLLFLIACLLLLTVASLPMERIRNTPWLASLLKPVAPLLGLPQSELTYVKTRLPVQAAAQPVLISVRNSDGRASVQWDFDLLDSNFESLGSTLGQALDTAGEFLPAALSQVQAALSRPSLYFSYSASLPAHVLAYWLDASLPEDAPSAYACLLSLEDEAVTLYLIGDQYYSASTSMPASVLLPLLEQFRPDGSTFAFEAGASAAPLSLISGSTVSVPSATLSDPCDSRYVEQLATGFGFNPYGDTRYTDTAGTIYFTEANCALQITEDGRLLLTSTAADRFRASGDSDEALIEEARRLVSLASGDAIGDARLYLTGLTREGSVTHCTFDYLFSGVPVTLHSGHAVTVSFQETSVTQMTMTVLKFTAKQSRLYPLPSMQAISVLPQGAPLVLQYHAGSSNLTAGWALEP